MLFNASMFTGSLVQSGCHFLHRFVLAGTGALAFSRIDDLVDSPGLIAM